MAGNSDSLGDYLQVVGRSLGLILACLIAGLVFGFILIPAPQSLWRTPVSVTIGKAALIDLHRTAVEVIPLEPAAQLRKALETPEDLQAVWTECRYGSLPPDTKVSVLPDGEAPQDSVKLEVICPRPDGAVAGKLAAYLTGKHGAILGAYQGALSAQEADYRNMLARLSEQSRPQDLSLLFELLELKQALREMDIVRRTGLMHPTKVIIGATTPVGSAGLISGGARVLAGGLAGLLLGLFLAFLRERLRILRAGT